MTATSVPCIDVRSFAPVGKPRTGEPNDPNADWYYPLQKALDCLVEQPISAESGTLYLPPGRYRISQPLQVRRQNAGGYTFCSVNILGDAPGYGAAAFHGTAIMTDFSDGPALVIQSGRAVQVENIVFQGRNHWASLPGRDPRDMATHYDDANYLAIAAVRDNRYSPHAGIHIDPYNAAVAAADRYPNRVLAAEYLNSGSGGGSSAIRICGCEFRDFVVGIGISLNGTTQNAENIAIDDCTITSVKAAIAIGQTQSRNVILRNLNVAGAKYAINCTDYGQGSGNCPSIFGANIGGVKYLFKTWSPGATPAINGLYCEACVSIGILGGGGRSADGYVFNACVFQLIGTPSRGGAPAKPAVFRLMNLARAVFNACTISAWRYPPPGVLAVPADNCNPEPLWLFNGGMTTLNNCSLGGLGLDAAPRVWVAGEPSRVAFNDCYTVDTPYDISDPQHPIPIQPDNSGRLSQVIRLRYWNELHDATVLPGAFIYWQTETQEAPTALRWVNSTLPSVVLGPALKVTVNRDGTGSFLLPSAAVGLVAPGDIIEAIETIPFEPPFDTGSYAVQLGRVMRIDPDPSDPATLRVTLHDVLDGLDVFRPGSLPSQTYDYRLRAHYFPRIHPPTTGDFSAANPDVITNVSLPHLWRVHERIRDAQGHIMEGTYITQISGQTFTLSRPWTGAAARSVALYDAKVFQVNMTQVY